MPIQDIEQMIDRALNVAYLNDECDRNKWRTPYRCASTLIARCQEWRKDLGRSQPMTMEHNVKLMISRCLSLKMLALEPNQINFVLSGLSCSIRDQSFRFLTHIFSRLLCSMTASSCMWSSSESSAYRWRLLSNLLLFSMMSSVNSMNFWGRSTEPWRTLQMSCTRLDDSPDVLNVC